MIRYFRWRFSEICDVEKSLDEMAGVIWSFPSQMGVLEYPEIIQVLVGLSIINFINHPLKGYLHVRKPPYAMEMFGDI